MVFSGLLCLMLSVFLSCKKDDPDPEPPFDPPAPARMTDSRDGKVYKIVTIGSQTWMAENLNYQGSLSAGKDTCYDNIAGNCTTYGNLYSWEAANTVAPAGWHLPTDEEWKTLEKYLGMSSADADLENYRGTTEGTKVLAGGGLNLPVGGFFQDDVSLFNGSGFTGRYWTSTLKAGETYYLRGVTTDAPNNTKIQRIARDNGDMNSVRCIKN